MFVQDTVRNCARITPHARMTQEGFEKLRGRTVAPCMTIAPSLWPCTFSRGLDFLNWRCRRAGTICLQGILAIVWIIEGHERSMRMCWQIALRRGISGFSGQLAATGVMEIESFRFFEFFACCFVREARCVFRRQLRVIPDSVLDAVRCRSSAGVVLV